MAYISEESAYRGLAAGIVLQAAEDYGMALLGQFNDWAKDKAIKEDCERFFKSEEIMLYTDIPGDKIKKKIEEMVFTWPKGKKFDLSNTII